MADDLVESLPYPFPPEGLKQLLQHDQIVDVHPEVTAARWSGDDKDWTTGVVAMLIETRDTSIALVERPARDGFRVLTRGLDAYEALQDWAEEHGYHYDHER